MTLNNRAEIDWEPKVSLSKIRTLYMTEASGLCDDELLDDVGTSLFQRCESILEFTEADRGCVRCKRCAHAGTITLIERKTCKPAEIVKCPICGWQVRWRVYLNEAEKSGGNLHVGHAQAAFERFVQTYPLCQLGREKILAIDLLIHEFHWILLEESQDGHTSVPHKPAGLNLLQGSTNQILEFLNTLTYGEKTAPELLANREWWRSQKPVIKKMSAISSTAKEI
jgi:hypothetical protein